MIFDIIIGLLVVFFAFKYYSEGLVNAVILFFSKIITFLVAFFTANAHAQNICDNYVSPKLYGYVDSIIVKKFNFEDIFESFEKKISTVDSQAIEALLTSHGIDIESLVRAGAESSIEIIRHNVIEYISYGFTYIVIFIIMLIIVTATVSFAMSFVDFIFEIPMLGNMNKIGGIILGVITGFFVSSLIIWTIITVMPTTTMQDGMFNEQVLENTYFIKHICKLTPSSIATLIF